MSSSTLSNYLRASRKRSGFSQKEVAILLGCKNGEAISRYERFARMPALETALALEIIFHTPVKELFRGEFRKVERTIHARAKRIVAKLGTTEEENNTMRKFARLKEMISVASE